MLVRKWQRQLRGLSAALLLLVPWAAGLAETATAPAGEPLIFGLLPSESAVTKIKRYAPLRDYLSKHLKRVVILETAPNFPEFVKRTGARKYDFLETAPHFVPAALDSKQYVVLTTIVQPLSAEIVVNDKSLFRQTDDLAGMRIATPSPKAIITKIGKASLTHHGLTGKAAPVYASFKTHNAAYEAVLGGQADAAIISVNIYNKALRKKEPLRVIAESEPIPNMSILAAQDLNPELRSILQATLTGMLQDAEGLKVLEMTSYKSGYRKANAEEFDMLRQYLVPAPDEAGHSVTR